MITRNNYQTTRHKKNRKKTNKLKNKDFKTLVWNSLQSNQPKRN